MTEAKAWPPGRIKIADARPEIKKKYSSILVCGIRKWDRRPKPGS